MATKGRRTSAKAEGGAGSGDTDSLEPFVVLLNSEGSKPLENWEKKVRNGHIRRVKDDLHTAASGVLELAGTNITSNYVSCPTADAPTLLRLKHRYLVIHCRALEDAHFQFEVQVLDSKGVRRRLRASTAQTGTRTKPFICAMPLRLARGWNAVTIDMATYTEKAFGTSFVEVLRVQLHANCRVRRVFLCARSVADSDLPRHLQPAK